MIPCLLKKKLAAKYGEDFVLPAHIDRMKPNKEAYQGLEHDMQVSLFQWVSLHLLNDPYLYLIHAIPNGGTRNKIEAGRLKAEGVKAGICDVSVPIPKKGFNGFYMELKAKANKPDETQRAVMLMLADQGFYVVCVNRLEDAINELANYLGIAAF